MPDAQSNAESREAGRPRRNVSLKAILTLLFVALLPGGVCWWRSQGIEAQVEAAGGAFHVHDAESNAWARMISRIEGRPSHRSHVIHFRYCEVDDEWLGEHRDQLAGLSMLTLNMGDCPVTDEGLRQLRGLDNIAALTLVDLQVTDAGLEHVAKLKNLQMLDLIGVDISVAGLEQLSLLRNLQRVQLQQTQLRDHNLAVLRQFPRLTSVLIDDSLATETGIAALRGCPQLVQLDLIEANDKTVDNLSGWVGLESLHVIGSDVTDASVPALTSLNGLTSLYLRDTSISDEGLAELQQALPNCRITSDETPYPPAL